MREPKIDEVLHYLEIGAYETEKVFQQQTSQDLLNELWYFLHQDRVNDLYEKIKDLPEDAKSKAIESLISLYPWSKLIVEKLVENYQTDDAIFLRVYDENEGLLKKMQDTIGCICGLQAEPNDVLTDDYTEQLRKLTEAIKSNHDRIKKLEDNNRELRKKRDELDAIQNEVKKLEKLADKTKYQEQYNQAKDKKMRLEKELHEREEDLKIIIDEIKKLEKSIKENPSVQEEIEERMPERRYEELMKTLEELVADED